MMCVLSVVITNRQKVALIIILLCTHNKTVRTLIYTYNNSLFGPGIIVIHFDNLFESTFVTFCLVHQVR